MNVDYGAAKAAMSNLTQALSEELAPQGIRVNTVSPGPVRTPWWTDEGGAAHIIAGYVGTDRDTVMATAVPELMRLTTGALIDLQHVADAVALLVSPRPASTTGADLSVPSCGHRGRGRLLPVVTAGPGETSTPASRRRREAPRRSRGTTSSRIATSTRPASMRGALSTSAVGRAPAGAPRHSAL
jgi:hypothetical protein